MTVLLKDEATGIEAGICSDGKLFLGNDSSGYNLPDNPINRKRMEHDFMRYTGKSLEYGMSWRRRIPLTTTKGAVK